MDELVRVVAHEAVALIDERLPRASGALAPAKAVAREALAGLGRLLQMQLTSADSEPDLFVRCAHDAMGTWLTGHASLLLNEASGQVSSEDRSLEDMARMLDNAAYGESERPKAFRRHLRSFYDEVDVTGSRPSSTAPDRPVDFVRVVLWVTLFLCHDYFAAIDEPSTARDARALFDRLRDATDDFYAGRRSAATRTGADKTR
jgi:hypothetical protein